MVRKQHRNETDMMYEFPAQFILQAGHVVTIWAKSLGLKPSPSTLIWESQRACRLGETLGIVLLDGDGNEIADGMITYLERGEGEGEVEDAAEQTKLGIHSQQNETRSCPIM
ncbi:PREDICTED: lamin-L(III)-like [Thamnophis sirtalis]|uniref:Lamin-L(III)-like n=1 Tax=Thamnophis sirtalis TaxID=35019 RepID=A0A6I9XN81_9SAUR|nr:PREDICTED: lamin-L(III)-like [Thamnophis sirtalis]